MILDFQSGPFNSTLEPLDSEASHWQLIEPFRALPNSRDSSSLTDRELQFDTYICSAVPTDIIHHDDYPTIGRQRTEVSTHRSSNGRRIISAYRSPGPPRAHLSPRSRDGTSPLVKHPELQIRSLEFPSSPNLGAASALAPALVYLVSWYIKG